MTKRLNLLSTIGVLMALTSCNFRIVSSNQPNFNTQSSASISSEVSTHSSETQQSSSSAESSKITSESSSNSVPVGDRNISIYSINDFHGQIKELSSSYEAGAAKFFSYLKKKNETPNTMLVNSGDLFQGALESNYNRGHLLTDLMNASGFDCMTLGNHEFDWGQSYITANKEVTYDTKYSRSYRTPFLAANIYDFDISTKTVGTTQQSQLGQEYTISTLENGLKVGIIGTIGTDQITSITSQNVDNITFVDPIKKTKELSNKLRTEEGVDFVIASIHAGSEEVLGQGLTSQSLISGKKYCDVIFTAHTHRGEYEVENGVPILQSYSNGKDIGHLDFTVKSDGTVTHSYTSSTRYSWIQYADISRVDVDPEIQYIVDEYAKETDPVGSEILTSFSGNFSSSEEVPNIMVESMYKEAVSQGFSVDFAMANTTRATIQSGKVTYSNLFNSVPFDNEVYIIKCKGEDIINEATYNLIYRANGDAVDETKTYTIAVLDYLATHRNSRRNYDYFPSMQYISSLKVDGEIINYRDCLAKHLRSKESWSRYDYSSSGHFDRNLLRTISL